MSGSLLAISSHLRLQKGFENFILYAGSGTAQTYRVHTSCSHYLTFRQLVLIISQVIVGANLLLRLYALYGQDKRILVLVLSISSVLIGFACWAVVGQKSDVTQIEGCHISLSTSKAVRIAVSWEALFAYDLLIVSLTFLKTWRERGRHRIRNGNDLFALIVRDGGIYFVVMACANFINTLTFYVLQPELKGVLSTFASSISVTMMSRLMLNLRQRAAASRNDYALTTFIPLSILKFRSPAGAVSDETTGSETLPTVQYDTIPPHGTTAGSSSSRMKEENKAIVEEDIQEFPRHAVTV